MAKQIIEKEPSIRKVYNPKGEEAKVRKYVYDRKRQMGDKRQEFENNWDKWIKQWDGHRPEKGSEDWNSDIFIPMTSSVIEAELSEIINQELKPWVVERGSEDRSKALVMNAIIDYTWDTSKSDVSLYEIIKDALIFGTGIGMEYFWKEQREIKTKDGERKKVLEFDDCNLEPVRLWDFYVDEKARSFSGPNAARDCIRRYIMDYDDFRSFFQGDQWDPMGNASLVKPGGDTNYYEFYSPPERLEHDREVEVLWYWNKPQDLLAIVANDIVIKMGPNPYKHKQLPFVRVIDIKKPYQFYGKGEPELLESLQEETNTLRRMIIDRNHLDIDKPILVSDTLTIEDDDTIVRPHGVIPVGDVNAAKPLEYSDIPMSVFKTLEMLNDDKIRVTGMDERQQSVSAAGTATEAAILKEATLKRLNMKIWQIKNDTLVDIGKLRVANILQFYSQPKLEEITGDAMVAKTKSEGRLVKSGRKSYRKEFRNIRLKDQAIDINDKTGKPELLPAKGYTFFEADPKFFLPTHGGYDIRYKATSSMPISKPLEQQKADEMYDRLAGNPTVDPWKLAKFLIESRDKDPDEFKVGQENKGGENIGNLEKMIDLAGVENDEMIRGNAIGPTPYASPIHTEAHVEFIKSKKFKEDVPPENTEIIQNFTTHIVGELMAQEARASGGSQQAPGQEGVAPQAGVAGGQQQPGTEMGDVMPDIIQGGGQVPSGMEGANSGVQVGRKV